MIIESLEGLNIAEVCPWKCGSGQREEGYVCQPNVNYLNTAIAKWIEDGYDFMGIFLSVDTRIFTVSEYADIISTAFNL